MLPMVIPLRKYCVSWSEKAIRGAEKNYTVKTVSYTIILYANQIITNNKGNEEGTSIEQSFQRQYGGWLLRHSRRCGIGTGERVGYESVLSRIFLEFKLQPTCLFDIRTRN